MQPHSPRIAVVDDDADVLESTRFLLEISGHVVQTFASACDFLAQLRLQAFDCVILDHHMPALTGLELAKRLRASGVTVPIMLMTGCLSTDILFGAMKLGIERIVEKPATESELMSFINAAG
jgi:two-component system response regulator FixJ